MTSPEARLACPNCGSDSDRMLTRRDGYDINRCTRCTLVFASPVPTEEQLNEYYSGYTFRQPSPERVNETARIYRENAAAVLREVERVVGSRPNSVFDFGGGVGFFSGGFRELVQDVAMYDVDPEACDFARTTFPGLEVHNAPIGTPIDLGRTFDVVFANQVIEHFTDPDAFFAMIAPACHPGTAVVVTTPNNRTWEHVVRADMFGHYVLSVGKLRAVWALLTDSFLCCDPPRHMLAFSKESLTDTFERRGVQVVAAFTHYTTATHYAESHYSHRRWDSPKEVLRSLIGLAARAGLRVMRGLDRRRERGSDLIVIGRAD